MKKFFFCDVCEVASSLNMQCTKCLKYFTLSLEEMQLFLYFKHKQTA